eukprot:Gregarina_sp_Pseudo_9__5414@NODE_668_length_2396_cov_8_599491_g631_i0_p5_GENE_NODE_668_length_2396_cov_8_599491_g631_i0NODE_668_length_2396_cov_8_599491_g631_i0_p5_ORF_typecomplete_len108_score12_64_NODE_668_length_2396_cov_8_599491_g631_i0120443
MPSSASDRCSTWSHTHPAFFSASSLCLSLTEPRFSSLSCRRRRDLRRRVGEIRPTKTLPANLRFSQTPNNPLAPSVIQILDKRAFEMRGGVRGRSVCAKGVCVCVCV